MEGIIGYINTIENNLCYIVIVFIIGMIIKILNVFKVIKLVFQYLSRSFIFPGEGEFGKNLLSECIDNKSIRKGKYSLYVKVKKGNLKIKIISLEQKNWHFSLLEKGRWDCRLFDQNEYYQWFYAKEVGDFDLGLILNSKDKINIEIYENLSGKPKYIRKFEVIE
ncbi:hypothetical protein HYE59_10530 [Aggregatibacter actinomycetemcomitans]|uniref:hypothetical protein n=1 Tax=Aggregatibacter actinomycetemcomitans TaxID=714 RepID=UPI00197C19DF|nr:hypothetical protein [Aggregatibacter actinomycetemcomitans]MBN6077944.1 hypothetical protein [Aggregatibacter actinomycetemcomitans]